MCSSDLGVHPVKRHMFIAGCLVISYQCDKAAVIPIRHRIDRSQGGRSGITAYRKLSHLRALFLAEIALALAFASAFDDAPQARRERRSLVGSPFLYSGPGIAPILAKKEARRGLSPDLTGALRLPPVAAL